MKKVIFLLVLIIFIFIFVSCKIDNNTKTYKVTFHKNNGQPDMTVAVMEGTKVVPISDPKLDNYTFKFWCTDIYLTNQYNWDTLIYCDFDLYAKFEVTTISTETLDIFYINDLHGMLTKQGNSKGISYIANFIKTKKIENPNTLFITGGDILQGSAVSNYFYGESTLTILNEMDINAFCIGNHEFDWGIETILPFFNGNSIEPIIDIPLLGANVVYKHLQTAVEGIQPYNIIEKNGLKIGIIGSIAPGLESSIAYSKISNYEFKSVAPIVGHYANELRTTKGCDIVLSICHSGGNENSAIANLSGSQRIDAIFNGHTHERYTNENNGVPIIQSGQYGEAIGHISLKLKNNKVISSTATNITNSPLLLTPNLEVEILLNGYKDVIDEMFSQKLISNPDFISRNSLSPWLGSLMAYYTDSIYGWQNAGGTRVDLQAGVDLTYYILYEVIPFDNVVKSCYLKGEYIKNFSYFAYGGPGSSPFSFSSLENNTYYRVVTNDYVFDGNYTFYHYGTDVILHELALRDLFYEELKLQALKYAHFSLSNPILITSSFTL